VTSLLLPASCSHNSTNWGQAASTAAFSPWDGYGLNTRGFSSWIGRKCLAFEELSSRLFSTAVAAMSADVFSARYGSPLLSYCSHVLRVTTYATMGYIWSMTYEVRVTKTVLKRLKKLPVEVVERFRLLAKVLKESGPTGGHKFRNYSKLSSGEYHCNLSYSYVACWRCETKSIVVEVYYVGSRESAPY
jgi:hypothetical protein